MLEARSLRKRFKDVEAVRGIDITVAPGERVGLLGPNGAGKTTTLLMLLGAVTARRGHDRRSPATRSRGIAVEGDGARRLRRRLPPAARSAQGARGARRVRRLVRRARPPRRPSTRRSSGSRSPTSPTGCARALSSGQRTLVGIVKATLHDPAAARARRADRVARPRHRARRSAPGCSTYCAATGAALLVTSHDMREVEMLTERVIFLARGEVVANDTPAAIAAHVRPRRPRRACSSTLAETHGR